MTNQPLAPSPLDVSLRRDIATGNINLIRTRWVAGVLILLATAFCVRVLKLPLPERSLYLVGSAVLLYNTALFWAARRIDIADGTAMGLARIRRLVIVQVGFDWVSMAAFLHLTGGICSPAIPFLLVHMLMVTILLPGRLPYLYVGLGIGVLVLIAALEWTGILAHQAVIPAIPPDLHTDPVFVVSQLAFTSITAFAIVHLTEAIMSRLRERERRIAILLQTAQDVSATLDPPELLHRLARNTAEALGVRAASIRLFRETEEDLALVAAYGLSQEYLDKGPIDLARSAVDGEVLAGRPVIIDETSIDPRVQYPEELAEEGIHSMLAVPIIGRGKLLGVLRVYAEQPRRFDRPDADFVMAIAHQGATALENALAYERLQREDEQRSQFVRMVTHELRAPVGGAQSLLRTLLRGLAGDLSAQQRDMLTRVEARLDMLLQLINDLLALAASKTVDMEQPLKRLPLQPVINQIVDRLTPEAKAKGVTLSCDLPFEVLAVRATEEGLLRVFDNLIGNAIKYTPPGGSVCVRVVERPAGAVITISDTGIGIPQEDLPHLWNNFFRARNARQSGIPGTGLGLTIVKQLVDHFGGLISVRSVEGQGTTFKLTLPLASPVDEPAV